MSEDLQATADELTARLADLSREHSRLNDRYMALLRDQESTRKAMHAVAMHDARFHAERIVRHAVQAERKAIASSLPYLLGLIEALPDKPLVRPLRPAAHALRLDMARAADVHAEHPGADLAAALRHELVTHHHEAFLAWREMGGQEETPEQAAPVSEPS